MATQELQDECNRLLGLIKNKMVPGVGNGRNFDVWARRFHLLQNGWRQTRAILRSQDQHRARDAVPIGPGINGLALGVDTAVDLVCPSAIGALACSMPGNMAMHFRRCP
jgi:hypothetical protein